MKPFQIVSTFAFAILLLQVAGARAQDFTDKGTTELSGTFSLSYGSSKNPGEGGYQFDSFIFGLSVGTMVAKGFEISFAPAVVSQGGGASVGLYLAPSYNITAGGKIYPFIEGVIGIELLSNVNSDNGIGYGGNFGVKSNLGGNFMLIAQLMILEQVYKSGSDLPPVSYQYKTSVTTVAFSAGFSIFFLRKTPTKK